MFATERLERQRLRPYFAVALAVLATGGLAFLVGDPATLTLAGVSYEVPLPAPHLCIGTDGASARYLLMGEGDLRGWLDHEAAAAGWSYREQLGSVHVLAKPGVRLQIARRQVGGGWLVRLDLSLAPEGGGP